MGGLLDVLRSAVVPAAAARGGYLAGERQRDEDRRRDEERKTALERQSRMDQMRELVEQSTISENTARAESLRRTKPPTEPAPHTVEAAEGIMQWDPTTRRFKPTGLHTPPRAGADGAGAASKAAKDKRAETRDALSGVEHQLDNSRQDLRSEENPPMEEPNPTRIGALRTRIDSLTHVSDSLNNVLKRPDGTPVPKATPRMTTIKNAVNPAQSEYDNASDAYQQALREATTPAEKEEARQLYDRAMARIARKRGQVR